MIICKILSSKHLIIPFSKKGVGYTSLPIPYVLMNNLCRSKLKIYKFGLHKFSIELFVSSSPNQNSAYRIFL